MIMLLDTDVLIDVALGRDPFAALACNAEVIVTRNVRHYGKSPVPAKEPRAVLGILTRT